MNTTRKSIAVTLIALLAACIPAFSQQDGPTKMLVTPFGSWMLCPVMPMNPGCATFEIGQASYQLLVYTDTGATVAFQYTITAQMQDGKLFQQSGVFQRTTGPYYSNIVFYPGGVIAANGVHIVIQELAVTSQTSN